MFFCNSLSLLGPLDSAYKTGSNILRKFDKHLPVGTPYYARRLNFQQDRSEGNKSNKAVNYLEFVYFNSGEMLDAVFTAVQIKIFLLIIFVMCQVSFLLAAM
jgi:hypothetical protein